jgi:hypothetical protein
MRISELKRAIREMIVGELNEAAFEYETPRGKKIGEFPTDSEAKAFDQRNNNVSNIKKLEEDALNEMASLVQASKEARRQGKNQEAEALEKHGLLIIKLPKIDKHKEAKLKVKSI